MRTGIVAPLAISLALALSACAGSAGAPAGERIEGGIRGGTETALREGLQSPNLDPLLVIPAMAAVTQRLGFGVTFSTTYEPPFAFARRMPTLDHLTRGRVGWNVVTSYLPNAARNSGLDGEVPHDLRHECADEYLDVLYKLWDGSWDDDALVADRERGIFTDPAKVRYIDHAGERHRVAGPHIVHPSPQRTPVIFQATGSPAGIEFAGRHAEVVFTGGRTSEEFRRAAEGMRDAAVRHGRGIDDVKFIAMAGVIVGRTEEEAADKWRLYQQHSSLDGILAHSSLPVGLTALPREITVAEALVRADVPASAVPFLPLEHTVGQALDVTSGSREDRFLVVGTAKTVADEIERWLDEDGLDGTPVVLTATGGSDRHALLVEHQMRPLFGFFQALTVPIGIFASQDDFDGYRLNSGRVSERIDAAVARTVPVVTTRLGLR